MKKLILLLGLLMATITLFAQGPKFDFISPDAAMLARGERIVRPFSATFAEVDAAALRDHLHNAPDEIVGIENGLLLSLPTPAGKKATFRIISYEMMEAPLAARFPEIVTLIGIDVNQPHRSVHLDWTYTGFHASVMGDPEGRWFIEPLYQHQKNLYQAYYTKDYPRGLDFFGKRICEGIKLPDGLTAEPQGTPKLLDDCVFRTYRLAVACTNEYRIFHGGTVAMAQSAITTTINRVNQVMRVDLAVRLELIDNTSLIENDLSSDGFDNDDANVLIDQSHDTITARIGSANFDIGHTFSTGAGGLAALGSQCNNSSKGAGVTGTSSPIGDPYDIDFVAHELGHQFGGNHTFNSTQSNCSEREEDAAYEPGGGTTIQGYAGICGPIANIQSNSDPYYHIISLEEFNNRMQLLDFFNQNCNQVDNTVTNNPPVLNIGSNHTIPKGTAFTLTPSSATDPDGDAILYCWEQYDLGMIVEAGIPSGNNATGPLFRSLPPTASPSRTFLDENSWETLPKVARTMNFKLTLRDVNATFGCTVADDMVVTVTDDGPFVVQSPNGGEEFGSGSTQTITWDEAGTDTAPTNCPNVDIDISIDGGATYTSLVTNVPNDGSQAVTMPTVTQAELQVRIRITCSSSIFFDVSDANFSITREEFGLVANTDESSICEGETTATGIDFDLSSLAGYTGTISYTATGLPAGVTATFTPPSPVNLTAGASQNVTVTLKNTGGLAPGTYPFRIEAMDGMNTKFIDVTLEVGEGGLILNSPDDGAEIPLFDDYGTDKVTITGNVNLLSGSNEYSVVIQGLGSLSFGNITGPGTANLSVTISNVVDGEMFTIFYQTNTGEQTCPITITVVDPALPVEWLDFTATPNGLSSLLEWKVMQDGRGLDYTIERKGDNDRDFIEAGQVVDSRQIGLANYTFTDNNVQAGQTYFYRIRQQDVDGAISYSPIRSVQFARDAAAVTALLIPNPASGNTVLQVDPASPASAYVLLDGLGRQVRSGTINGPMTTISLAGLPRAIYHVMLRGEGFTDVLRLVKQ